MCSRRCLPGYSPMEAGTLQCDERSDIYSFGRTCYVLRHGCFPDEKDSTDALDDLFLRCCREDKKQRYSNMGDVVRELQMLCEE